MKHLSISGFTIIETMLFLAISGLLLAGILVGTGNSINTQRYRDSVSSLQSFFQQQYSDVANVSNDRSSSDQPCIGDNMPRGQSDCLVLGKFITTVNSPSTKLSIKNVVGYPSSSLSGNDDITVLSKVYTIKVSPIMASTYDIEWNAFLVKNAVNANGNLDFSMLILRSPSSGTIRTFISSSVVKDSKIKTLVNQSFMKKSVMCVASGLSTGPKMAVVVDADATSASNIEIWGESLQFGVDKC
jgi:type II secretory pathway pseudopilin PulG